MSYVEEIIESEDGDWVPAEVAQALYDSLENFVKLSGLDGEHQRWPRTLKKAKKALSLADGEDE